MSSTSWSGLGGGVDGDEVARLGDSDKKTDLLPVGIGVDHGKHIDFGDPE
jgi:hypothetical protein